VNPWKNKLIWLLVSLYSAIAFAGPGLHFVPGVPGCGSHCSVINADADHNNSIARSDASSGHCEESCPFHKHASAKVVRKCSDPVARGLHNHDDCAVCKLLATLSHSLLIDFQLEQAELSVGVSAQPIHVADRFSFGLFQSRAPPFYR
jgi:hypothetical protein